MQPTETAAEIGIDALRNDSTPFRAVTIVFDQREILDEWIKVIKRSGLHAAEISEETVDRFDNQNDSESNSGASAKSKGGDW